MTDYMKEAERLMRQYTTAVLEKNSEAIAFYHFTLLAHIQRGAVPDGWQVVPKEPTKDMVEAAYDNVTGGGGRAAIYAAMLAAAPAPDHFRDAAEMVPEFSDSARAALLWVLWHHQGGSSPVGQPIRFALGMGQHEHLNDWQLSEARRWGQLSGLAPGACRDTAPAPADVPMPEPDTHCYDEDERRDVWSHSADQMRTYGERCRAAGEAAGYARGRADERERICAAIKAEDDYCVTEGDYMLDSEDCISVARGTWERPDYAALRGEEK